MSVAIEPCPNCGRPLSPEEVEAHQSECPGRVGVEVIEYDEVPAHAPTTLFRTDDPAQVLERATAVANALAPVIADRKLSVKIGQKEHITVEAWLTLGAMLGVTPVCTWSRKFENGWEARVEARTLDGRVVGAAEAECLRDESRWEKSDDYAIRSMAQTRATSKALASVLRFVATLAGYSGTPAEEMPREGGDASWQEELASSSQKGLITRRCNELGVTPEDKRVLFRWAGGEPFTKGKASKLIEELVEAKDYADVWKRTGIDPPLPADDLTIDVDPSSLHAPLEDPGPEDRPLSDDDELPL
jgi:hypothetical protein